MHRVGLPRRLLVVAVSFALGAGPCTQAGATIAVSLPTVRDVPAAERTLVSFFGGAADDYRLLQEWRLAIGGHALWAAKFLDTRTDRIRLVYRDDAGNTGGPELLDAAEERAVKGLSPLERKATPELRAAAAHAPPGGHVPVAVWLDADPASAVAGVVAAHPEGHWLGDRPQTTDDAMQRRLLRLVDAARGRVYAEAAATVARAMSSTGGRLGYVSLLAPLAYVDTPAASLDRLAALPAVRSLGLETHRWRESLASAGPYVHSDWTSGSEDYGWGVRVGLIEYYNVRATGDLAGKVVAFHSMSGSRVYEPVGLFDHPSWTAGAIASQDARNRGIAPGADIVSSAAASGSTASVTRDRNVIRAADWAATTGDADILNVSVNMDTATGRDEARAYFDAVGGGEAARLVVASAGNWGTGVDAGTWLVSSPGTAWNVLTVGGMNDGTSRLWYDPTCPCSGSLWDEDPDWPFNGHGDFNKPDVSAPAVDVETANGWRNKGTSVAAPIVSGIAAQLFARNRSVFRVWPEAMRAIIMAGAIRRVPLPGGGTNTDHEGVGTVDARYAQRIYLGGAYGGWARGKMQKGTTLTKSFSVSTGQNVRVVLAWDSHTSGSVLDKTDALMSDLDLVVSYPGGKKTSTSMDNASEAVAFKVPSSGTVRITVSQTRFDRSSEYWGLAWVHW